MPADASDRGSPRTRRPARGRATRRRPSSPRPRGPPRPTVPRVGPSKEAHRRSPGSRAASGRGAPHRPRDAARPPTPPTCRSGGRFGLPSRSSRAVTSRRIPWSYPPRILSPPEDRIGVDNRTVRALRRGRSPGDRSRFDRSVPPIPYDPQSCANSRSRAKEPVNEASEVRGARGTMARGIRGRPIVPEERSVVRPRNLAAPGNDLTGYATESPLAAGSPSDPSRSGKPVARSPVRFRSRTVARDRIPLAPGAGRNRRNRRGSPRGAAPAFPFRRTRRAGARALSVRMRLPAGPSFDTVGSQP